MSSQPRPSMMPLSRETLWAERLSIITYPDLGVGASTPLRYASNTLRVVAPSTASDGPMPSVLMLESSVTFFPQLRGAFAGARSPRLDQA